MSLVINIANDFSRYPGPRYKDLGKYSGEEFREDFLIPALRSTNEITIVLDGAMGYGSSFLEEAFGGLIRCGFELEKIRKSITIISKNDPDLINDIEEYLTNA